MGSIKNDSYRRNIITVKAGIPTEFIFKDSTPNVCFIRNTGTAELIVGIEYIPSDLNYDEKIASSSKQSVARPIPFNRICFTSIQDANLFLESFQVEDMKPADIPETQPVLFTNVADIILGDINSLISPLPAGTNNIGKIDINSSIPAGTNLIGKVDINKMVNPMNIPQKITIPAGQTITVKSVDCFLIATLTTATDLIIKNGLDAEIWQGNISLLDGGMFCAGGLKLSSVVGATVYTIYRDI